MVNVDVELRPAPDFHSKLRPGNLLRLLDEDTFVIFGKPDHGGQVTQLIEGDIVMYLGWQFHKRVPSCTAPASDTIEYDLFVLFGERKWVSEVTFINGEFFSCYEILPC